MWLCRGGNWLQPRSWIPGAASPLRTVRNLKPKDSPESRSVCALAGHCGESGQTISSHLSWLWWLCTTRGSRSKAGPPPSAEKRVWVGRAQVPTPHPPVPPAFPLGLQQAILPKEGLLVGKPLSKKKKKTNIFFFFVFLGLYLRHRRFPG